MQDVQTTASVSEPRNELPKKPKKPRKAYFKLFGKSYKKSDSLVGIGFILPACILGILFIFVPIAISLLYAFTDMEFTDVGIKAPHFIGFENFRIMFAEDKVIWKALGNTFLFVVVAVPVQLAVLPLGVLYARHALACGNVVPLDQPRFQNRTRNRSVGKDRVQYGYASARKSQNRNGRYHLRIGMAGRGIPDVDFPVRIEEHSRGAVRGGFA